MSKICFVFSNYYIIFYLVIKSNFLVGVYANMLRVSGTAQRTNNVLEISHQNLKMHIGNNYKPDTWVFLYNILISLLLKLLKMR